MPAVFSYVGTGNVDVYFLLTFAIFSIYKYSVIIICVLLIIIKANSCFNSGERADLLSLNSKEQR